MTDQPVAPRLRSYQDDLVAAVGELQFTVSTGDASAHPALLLELEKAFGACAFASFDIVGDLDPLARQLRSFGNGMTGPGDPYANRLLSSDAVRGKLPDLAIDPGDLPDAGYGRFELLDPVLLESSLAMVLRVGGPHSGLSGPSAQTIAHDFCASLMGERLEDFVILSGEGWTGWFHGLGWDHGWIISDLGSKCAYVLCCSGAG